MSQFRRLWAGGIMATFIPAITSTAHRAVRSKSWLLAMTASQTCASRPLTVHQLFATRTTSGRSMIVHLENGRLLRLATLLGAQCTLAQRVSVVDVTFVRCRFTMPLMVCVRNCRWTHTRLACG